MKSKITAASTAMILRSKDKALSETLAIQKAANEIADAFNIKYEAAMMTLYGLCATGKVRWVNDQGLIDEDECTIADFSSKPKWVVAEDVRSFLTDCSSGPQPSRREAVIAAMIAEGLNPTRNIPWKKFGDRVRDECNGWLGKRPALGFSQKQIQRIVKDLRSK